MRATSRRLVTALAGILLIGLLPAAAVAKAAPPEGMTSARGLTGRGTGVVETWLAVRKENLPSAWMVRAAAEVAPSSRPAFDVSTEICGC